MDSLYGKENSNYRGSSRGGRGGFRGGRGGGRGGYGYNNRPVDNGPDMSDRFGQDDKVAVKIRGLPYQVRYEEIQDFFGDFKVIPRSVILGLNNEGRKNGFGAILFDNEEEASAAAAGMNGQHVGDRYVDLNVIAYGDYKKFNKPSGGSNYSSNTVKLSNFVDESNKDRSLVMRGLPYRATTELVQNFFEGFGTLATNDIFIEEFNGRRTGSALVVFENESVA